MSSRLTAIAIGNARRPGAGLDVDTPLSPMGQQCAPWCASDCPIMQLVRAERTALAPWFWPPTEGAPPTTIASINGEIVGHDEGTLFVVEPLGR